MKLKSIKGSLVIAAAIAAMSTSAMATASGATQLNDAELDEVTAGTVSSISLILITPSNRSVEHVDPERGRLICINCSLIGSEFPKSKSAYGVIVIERNGQVFEHLIGKWPVIRP